VEICSCYKEEHVAVSGPLEDVVKRWTAKRKSALVIEIIQGQPTVTEASRGYDLSPSEIEGRVDDAHRAWIMRCGQTRSIFARNSKSSFVTCRRPTARPRWNFAREESWRPSWLAIEPPPVRGQWRTEDDN